MHFSSHPKSLEYSDAIFGTIRRFLVGVVVGVERENTPTPSLRFFGSYSIVDC